MTILDSLAEGLLSSSPEETEDIGRQLALSLPKDCALALHGDLGSGKTTLVRGLARGLGIQSEVTSPTYTIYTLYEGTRQLLHMDAYRLATAAELESLTLEEFLRPPFLIAVEWPENIAEFFREYHTYRIALSILPDHQHHLALLSGKSGK